MKICRLMSMLILSMLVTGAIVYTAYGGEGPLNNRTDKESMIKAGYGLANPAQIPNITDKESLIKAGFDSVNPLAVPNRSTNKSGIDSTLSDQNILQPAVISTLAEALDNYDLAYTSGGQAYWYGDSTIYFYGGDAARSGPITDNSESWMQTTVTGPGTVRFWWSVSSEANFDYLEFYLDGMLQNRISGSVPWQLQNYYISSSGIHILKWRYVKDGSGSVGNDAGYVDKLEYYSPPISLGEAVDNNYLAFWSGSSGATWIGQNSVYYHGGDSARSGTIPNNGYTYMYTTVTGPGTIRFLWSVSSETCCDYLAFYIDGVLQDRISGYVPWRQQNYYISTGGAHTLMWQYTKDGSVSVGDDAGWIDKVEYYYPPISLGDAVNPAFTFTTGGAYTNWIGQYVKQYYGASARSGTIMENQNTWMQTSVAGPGTIRFWWSVSSESCCDHLLFYIDGNLQDSISGEVDWQQKRYNVGTGTHYLTWQYTKDGSVIVGDDAGWVDKLEFSEPTITVLSPNGGENWERSTTQTINWLPGGIPEDYVTIELLKGGVLYSVISSGTPDDGSYSWTIPPTQTLGSDYKIRIASTTSTATDTSDDNFIISPSSSITILSPNGGENWLRGTIQTISWSSVGSPGDYVLIELLKGGILNSVISSSTPNDGSYSWTISPTQTLGSDYKVRITSTSNPAYTDTSNSNFIIGSQTSITVTYPNGGEKLVRGTTKAIRWSYSGSPGTYVKIELLKAGILNRVISSSTPIGVGYYNWAIPSTQTLGSDYKIRVTSTSNSAYTDTSNNNFIISSPTSITVTYPNGGEKLVRGTTKAVRWSYSGSPGTYVKIELLKAGILNRVISSSTPIGLGYYNWAIPSTQTLGSDYKIKITSTSNPAYTDMSNNNFIVSNPYITVGSPNGGENWGRGTTHTISWTSAGSTGTSVKIELFKNGVLNRVISSSTPNDGSYSWVVPSTQTLGTDYKIKITSTSNSVYNDMSNSNFRIS